MTLTTDPDERIVMPGPPDRYKDPAQLDIDETLRIIQAQRRGQPTPKFESDEYRRHRSEALRAAGLSEEADELDPDRADTTPESMAVVDHLAAVQRRAR